MSQRKLFAPNTVCIVLRGRHAGKKCVVVSADENRVTVVGIEQAPKPVYKTNTPEQAEKRSKVVSFVKVYSASHLMPTRYTYKQDFSQNVKKEIFKDANLKKQANMTVQKKLQQDYLSKPENFLFKRLYF